MSLILRINFVRHKSNNTQAILNVIMIFWLGFGGQKIKFEHHKLSLIMRKPVLFAYAKTQAQISCAGTERLISAFIFATYIVQFLYFLNPKF